MGGKKGLQYTCLARDSARSLQLASPIAHDDCHSLIVETRGAGEEGLLKIAAAGRRRHCGTDLWATFAGEPLPASAPPLADGRRHEALLLSLDASFVLLFVRSAEKPRGPAFCRSHTSCDGRTTSLAQGQGGGAAGRSRRRYVRPHSGAILSGTAGTGFGGAAARVRPPFIDPRCRRLCFSGTPAFFCEDRPKDETSGRRCITGTTLTLGDDRSLLR